MRPTLPSQELCSWKEIAAYLGVSVKTAQLWEQQRGMPVRRLPGARGQVRALVSELEGWKVSNPAPPAPVADVVVDEKLPKNYLHWGALGLVGGLIVIAGFFFFMRPVVASVRVEADAIAGIDKDGNILWRRMLGLLDATRYQSGENQPWIGDLDADGKLEILFVPVPAGSGPFQASIPIICFKEDGREAWRYAPNRTVRRGENVYDNFYVVKQFTVIGSKIVVTSHHGLRSSAQVAVLDPNGKLLREYWHPGHLNSIVGGTYNRKPVVLLAGVNNIRKLGTLVVLDPEQLAGAALENAKASFDGMQAGVEEARILFPQSKLSPDSPYNSAISIISTDLGWTVHVKEKPGETNWPTNTFHLKEDLSLLRVTVSDQFKLLFRTKFGRDWSAQDQAELSKINSLKAGSE